jgi:hypothetical protein
MMSWKVWVALAFSLLASDCSFPVPALSASAGTLFAPGLYPIFNIKGGHPMSYALECGLIVGKTSGSSIRSETMGPFLSVEPGATDKEGELDLISFNLGYGHMYLRSEGEAIIPFGYRIGLSYSRSMNGDSNVSDYDNCLGIRVGGSVLYLVAFGGACLNLGSDTIRYSAGLGIGF